MSRWLVLQNHLYKYKYNNWCKASTLIAPALTIIWSYFIFNGFLKKEQYKIVNWLLLVFYYFHNYHFNQ